MGPYIQRRTRPDRTREMGVITVTMPSLVVGPHQWRSGRDGERHQLICNCGWICSWPGGSNLEVDNLWRRHHAGEDDG